MTEPQEPVETFLERDSHKRKLTWAQELIREAKRCGIPGGIHRESEKGKNPTIVMWIFCVTSLTKKLPPMKRL